MLSCLYTTPSGESTPRGGSPFPGSGGRRHGNLYSPSRAQTSYLIRSVSREEDEEGRDEEERIHPAYRSERQPGARTRVTSSNPVPTPHGVSYLPCGAC